MTQIILATGGMIAVAAYLTAVVMLAVDEVVERSIALARMVSGVADPNESTDPEVRPRDIAAQTIVNQLTNQEVIA